MQCNPWGNWFGLVWFGLVLEMAVRHRRRLRQASSVQQQAAPAAPPTLGGFYDCGCPMGGCKALPGVGRVPLSDRGGGQVLRVVLGVIALCNALCVVCTVDVWELQWSGCLDGACRRNTADQHY